MRQTAYKILMISMILSFPLSLKAQESATVSLGLPPQFFSQACPAPVWQGLKVQWLGTSDERTSPEVGVESKKNGKDPIVVTVTPSLAGLVDGNLKDLLTRCGMILLPPGEGSDLKLSAKIIEFHAGVEKGIILGKGKAKSRLSIVAEKPGRRVTASVGYEIEFKKTRKGSLERMKETLNELLAKTLEQVPASPELKALP